MTNWTSASDKADLLRAASGKQSHHTSDAIQHNKLLKCSPSLKPEDCEFTVKQNNEQARSAYYFTHSCHLPLPRVRDSQLNFTGTYGKYLDTCTCQEYDSLIPPCVCSGGSTSKQHLIFTLSLQCFPSQLRNMSFFKIFFIYLFFLSIRFRPRYCPTLTAMFYNDLVISLDAADLHCISLKLEWDLILLQPCRSAVRKKKKRKMFKLNAWLVLSLIKMCSAAAFPWTNHGAWRLVSVMSGCKALGEVCVLARPFIAAQLSERKN